MRLIYLAAPWKYRDEAKKIAALLRAEGHQVVSRWHDMWALRSEAEYLPEDLAMEAAADLLDLASADVVLVMNWDVSEGKAVEQGFALARKIPIIVVGVASNVFHYLPGVTVVRGYAEALIVLPMLA